MTKFLIVFSLILFPIICFPQSPNYKFFSTDDGLPSNEVYHVMQDSKAYIWFGTDNGVSRYDGYEFKNYNLSDGLPDNGITYLFEDNKCRIWFLSFSNKLSYFFNDSIYTYKYNDVLRNYLKNTCRVSKLSFFVDSNDVVYLGTTSQGVIIIKQDGSIYNIKTDNTVQLYIKDNTVLIGRVNYSLNEAIQIIDKTSRLIKTDILNKIRYTAREYSIKNKNKIFFASNTSIIQIENCDFDVFEMDNYIVWLSIDKANNLWVGHYNGGVNCFKKSDLNSTPIHYLKDKTVSSVLFDNENGTWITTLNGVYYYSTRNINTFTTNDGLSSNKINCIEKGLNSKVWFTTSNEYINSYKRKLEEFKMENASFIHVLKYNSFDTSICYGAAHQVENVITNCFKQRNLINNNKFGGWQGVKDIYCLENNISWIIDENLIKIKNDTVVYVSRIDGNVSLKPFKMLFLNDSLIWLGCKDGLWKYSGGKIEYYGDKDKLLSYKINDIIIDNNKNLYIATKGVGLIIMKKDTILQITKSDGLSDNTVSSLFFDNDIIWAGTFNGLNKIIITENEQLDIQVINEVHGIASKVVNDVIVVNDTVYVGTDKGLSFFNKTLYLQNKFFPPVYITRISIMEKDTVLKDNYILPYNQNSITIDFVGLNYKNAGNVKYLYKLSGIDNRWVSSNINKVRYPSLKPGSYIFSVYAVNEDGYKSTNPVTVHFIINTPFWNTWWFYTLLALTFVLIVLAVYISRINNIRKREKLKQELNKYRQQALGKQMNPHFIFNSLNSIQHFILKNNRKDSNKYLAKFANLMRQTLENSRHDSIPFADELNALNLYLELESLRFKEKFQYKIIVDSEIDQQKNKVPTLLIQPYVENSIWHGIMHKEISGYVKIELIKKADHILCVIEDNGVGRKRSAEINANTRKGHKSMGTSITESRLNLINSLHNFNTRITYTDLVDKNNKGIGTKVEITLPHI